MKKKAIIISLLVALIFLTLSSCREDYVPEVVKVQSINITGENIKINPETNAKYAIVRKNSDGKWVYQLEYTVAPDNATNAKVDFVYGKDAAITVSDSGFVTFSEPDCAIIIKIMATDGSGTSDTITLYSR
jgi:hypothetical protein